MHIRSLFLSVFLLLTIIVRGQSLSPQVFASAGNYFDNGTFSLSWTLGEPIIETFTTVNIILTQGFQQPYLTPVGIGTLSREDSYVKIYPNPTYNIVRVDLRYGKSGQLELQLINGLGQLIRSDQLNVEKNQQNNYYFDISDLAAGVYHLHLFDKDGIVSTHKVQKLD